MKGWAHPGLSPSQSICSLLIRIWDFRRETPNLPGVSSRDLRYLKSLSIGFFQFQFISCPPRLLQVVSAYASGMDADFDLAIPSRASRSINNVDLITGITPSHVFNVPIYPPFSTLTASPTNTQGAVL